MTKESDGQNEYNRFSSVDLKQLAKDTYAHADRYKQILLNALSVSVPSRVQQSTVVTPTYDPVTG